MKNILFVLALLFVSISVQSEQPYRIEIGSNYNKYSNEELRRRVWQLERAVAQLQDQVFQLAIKDHGSMPPPSAMWTCQIQSMGKTYVASRPTKASALAQTLKECSDANNAVFCKEADAKCSNE